MPEVPRPEYPRPQLRRDQWVNLNGPWRFAFDDDDRGIDEGWAVTSGSELTTSAFDREIFVPFCPQSDLSGIGDPAFHDVLWYARTFPRPTRRKRDRVILHFGAVDYRATVWVNGQLVGRHEGGHTPFHLDVTAAADLDENVVVVRAEDPGRDPELPRGKQDWHEKPSHIFYNRTSGIWQTVWLETVPDIHVTALRMTPRLAAGSVDIEVELSAATDECTVDIRILDQGREVGCGRFSPEPGASHVAGSFELDGGRLRLWQPSDPHLYDVAVTVFDAGGQRDEAVSYLGVRSIEVEGDRLLLNKEPLYLRMILDHGYWPDGLMTAPTDDALRKDIALAQAMGFNGVRKHQKIEDPRWLYWADRMGMLVWAEMVNAPAFSPAAVERTTREWIELIRRDYNHPCVIAWVPVNESLGCRILGADNRTPVGDFHGEPASALYFLTKALDPHRPVVSNDGYEHTFSDLCTIHDYSLPKQLIRRLESQESLLSPGPQGEPVFAAPHTYRDQPILLSEFGGILSTDDAAEFGYSHAGDPDELLSALTQFFAVVHASQPIRGYCYTQLTDVEQEVNGLLTSTRQPKISTSTIAALVLNQPAQRGSTPNAAVAPP